MTPLRVAVWGTGNVGRRAVAAIAGRPDMAMVGGWVHDPAKVGRDVGQLAGLAPLGVAATADPAAIVALAPDAVLHAPLPSAMAGDDPDADTATLCRLLAAGINVVTTVGYLYQRAHGAAPHDRLDVAARTGGATLHGTGLNPGMQGDRLPLVLSALSGRIERVTISEATVFDRYPSAAVVFGLMGMGLPEAAFHARTERYRNWLTGLFNESVLLVAHGLGLEVDRLTCDFELALAETRYAIAAGVVEAGTVAAQRWRWSAEVGGRDRVVHETLWRAHASVVPGWGAGENAIRIDGQPAIRLMLAPDWTSDGLAATALHAVNAIPAVVAAAPGIATALDLPMFSGRAS